MSQTTLLPPQPKPVLVLQPQKITNSIPESVLESDPIHEKISAWLQQCKIVKENFAYFHIQYHGRGSVGGFKEEWLTTSTTMERPFRPQGDSYGGSWGFGGQATKEGLNELKQGIIAWRKDFLDVPYYKEKGDGTALRDIKSENVRVFFDEKAKEFIACNASWTLQQLTNELQNIQETPLTTQYLQKVERMKFLDKEIHRLEYNILPGLKGKAENAFNNKAEAQTVLDGEAFDLNAIYRTYDKLKHKLEGMKKEYDALRRELYRWG